MQANIVRLNDQGLGVCYINDKVTFVYDAIPGDIVKVEVINENKKYNLAKVVEVIKRSDDYIDSLCPYSNTCGGCSLFNLEYSKTLEYKSNKLTNILKKFSNLSERVEVIENKNKLNYRNKIRLHVKNGLIGYYSSKTNDVVEITNCVVAKNIINEFIPYINKYGIINGEIIIRCNDKDELLINFITNDEIKLIDCPINIIGILKNNKVLSGNDYFIHTINDLKFKVSYDSFFQVNDYICSKLFSLINEYAIKDCNVLDLYCGTGTLGLSIAKNEKKIYGIEIVENAIKNAKENSILNNLFNTKYYCGDVADILPNINDNIDLIIVDPPRSGLDKKSTNIINKLNPKQIIYISCDPITLARDLNYFNNYNIKMIKGLDMFSYSYHCESVVVLERIDE